jgi:hypothetical protein
MGLLHNLRLRFFPPKMTDPEFGQLLFMYIPNNAAASYWEFEWVFPKTGKIVSIGLPGDADLGPVANGPHDMPKQGPHRTRASCRAL